MAKETVSCVICGREHDQQSDDVAKIHHPTKPLTAAYACRSHRGIDQEHARCYPLEYAHMMERKADQMISFTETAEDA